MTTYGAVVTRPIVGRPFETSDGSLYAYSGMLSYGGHAADATIELMRFNLQKDSRFNLQLNANWNLIDDANVSIGMTVSLNSTDIIQWVGHGYGHTAPTGPLNFDLYIPANAQCVILAMNPDGASGVFNVNCTLTGNYLEESSIGEQVGQSTVPPGLRNLPRDGKKRASNFDLIGAVAEGW